MINPIVFGKYYLLEPINKGGMAEVFRAKEFGVEGFERILAIKRILPDVAADDQFVTMFKDEARLTVQLQHANITQVYELSMFEGSYYIAMEYIPGKDLRHILDYYVDHKILMPIPQVAFIINGICEGLDYAHRKCDPQGRSFNIVHRDVSPQNVLINYDGWVKVIDFGIAKAENRETKTQVGVIKGKFAYMSPEQITGKKIDRRSDIFAIGIMLYEMLTGRRLFVGENDLETLSNISKCKVPNPKKYNPQIDDQLEAIIRKALAQDREQRYQWASELAEDLQPYLIHNNTIFGRKQLKQVMEQIYAQDIAVERARMQEYAKVKQTNDDAKQMEENANPNKTCVLSAADLALLMAKEGHTESAPATPPPPPPPPPKPAKPAVAASKPAPQPAPSDKSVVINGVKYSAAQESDILKNNLLRGGFPQLFEGRYHP